jgi:hypothetical protein
VRELERLVEQRLEPSPAIAIDDSHLPISVTVIPYAGSLALNSAADDTR